jgi:branched-chain amino acid transport system permease protein
MAVEQLRMNEFLQQLINGCSLGAVYALIALGYTMVYGVLRFINFAHSDVFMVGAFIGYYLAPYVPKSSFSGGLAVLFGAMIGCAILGVLIERFAYRPLRKSSKLNVLITAIGVSLLLENAGQHFFKADPKAFPALFPTDTVKLGGLVISSNQIAVLVLTTVLLLGLQFIVQRTKIGIAMRAVSFNPAASSLVGINIDLVISFTFALGSALAAAGGILYATNYPAIDPLMGIVPGLKAFVAAVLGGIGNIPGAALGGLILGIVETFVNGSRHFSTYTDAVSFAILILILLFKPAGILGRVEVEKV